MSRMLAVLAILAVAAALAVACGGASADRIPTGIPEPDRALFERASASLKEEAWLRAREDFRAIVDGYPQSQYRAEAKLGVGDTYLGENTPESLVLAINEFREFLTFYPTHPRADYAQYRLGMASFNQMRSADRDQTHTREAIKELQVFVERYPNSSLMNDARARLREARDRLSESEYRVGLFYYRIQWYVGAIDRFRQVLREDPEYTGRDAVYFHLAESLYRTNKKPEALPYYGRLLKEFAASDFLKDAQKRVEELKGA